MTPALPAPVTNELALRQRSLIEACYTLWHAASGIDESDASRVALEQAEASLFTLALLYTAAMIRDAGEAGTLKMAELVEQTANFAESLVVNVRQGDSQ